MAVTINPLVEGRVLLVNYVGPVDLPDVNTMVSTVVSYMQQHQLAVHTLNNFTDFNYFETDISPLVQRVSSLASHPLYRWSLLYGLSHQRVPMGTIYGIFGFRVRVCNTAMQAIDFLYRMDESLGEPPSITNLQSSSA